jgi:hypothetical protein
MAAPWRPASTAWEQEGPGPGCGCVCVYVCVLWGPHLALLTLGSASSSTSSRQKALKRFWPPTWRGGSRVAGSGWVLGLKEGLRD